MKAALRAVRNEEMGFLKASKIFNVSRSTLKRRVNGKNDDALGNIKVLRSRHSVFSLEQEQELVYLELKKRDCRHCCELET